MPDNTEGAERRVPETDVRNRDKHPQPIDRKKDDDIGKVNGSPTPLPDEKAVESGPRRLPGELPAADE
jgi:hypothetical protein